MTDKKSKIYSTTVISSEKLDRSDEIVQHIRSAWDNLPEDIDMTEREMFVEVASKVIRLHHNLIQDKKSRDGLN